MSKATWILKNLLQIKIGHGLGVHCSMCQTLSPQRHSNTSSSLWMRIGKPSCERLDYLIFPLSAKLRKVNSIRGLEKLKQSCLCESPFDLGGKFCFRLTDPNTFSPSKCNILNVYEKLGVNLTTIVAICNGS
jgi:hypothetical protein